jgi:hypothetical protein
LKNSKSGPSGGGGLLRCDLQAVETILQVFRIFKQVEKRGFGDVPIFE